MLNLSNTDFIQDMIYIFESLNIANDKKEDSYIFPLKFSHDDFYNYKDIFYDYKLYNDKHIKKYEYWFNFRDYFIIPIRSLCNDLENYLF